MAGILTQQALHCILLMTSFLISPAQTIRLFWLVVDFLIMLPPLAGGIMLSGCSCMRPSIRQSEIIVSVISQERVIEWFVGFVLLLL